MLPTSLFGLAVLGAGLTLASRDTPTRDTKPASFARPKRLNGGLTAAPLRRKAPTGRPPVVANPCLPVPSPEGIDTEPLMKDLSYQIEFLLGYPVQKVSLSFDTGSSETWVDPYCSEWIYQDSPTYEEVCVASGAYHTQQSETAAPLNVSSEILYGSGAVSIDYWTDILTFPESNGSSFSIRQVQFGVATSSESMTSGLFGASFGQPYNQNYSNVIDELYNQGFILDKDFSVALGAVDQEKGEILFGGYDTGKFTGPLVAVDLADQQEDDDYFRYWINNTYIGITQPGYSCVSVPLTPSNYSEPMLPDTGTTLTYLPGDVFELLVTQFPGAYFNAEVGLYQVFCDYLWMKGTVDFGFGSGPAITIRVPFHDFVYQIEPMEENNYTASCFIGAVPSFGFSILGDTFLRSAFLLFRQDARTVHLAQASDCGTNFVSSHNIPADVVGDCDAGFGGADQYATSGCSTEEWTPVPTPSVSLDWKHVAGLDKTRDALQPHLPTGNIRPASAARATRLPSTTVVPSQSGFTTIKNSTASRISSHKLATTTVKSAHASSASGESASASCHMTSTWVEQTQLFCVYDFTTIDGQPTNVCDGVTTFTELHQAILTVCDGGTTETSLLALPTTPLLAPTTETTLFALPTTSDGSEPTETEIPTTWATADEPEPSTTSTAGDEPDPYGDESSAWMPEATTSAPNVIIPLGPTQTIEIFQPDTTIYIIDGTTWIPPPMETVGAPPR